jgi:hypothetical protein
MRSASGKAATVSALPNDVKQMELRAGAKKEFETNSRVSSLLQVCPRSLLTAESGFSSKLGRSAPRKRKVKLAAMINNPDRDRLNGLQGWDEEEQVVRRN